MNRKKIPPDFCSSSCSPKPSLEKRELLSLGQASDLEDLFKVLANDTRLRLLHALVLSNELCVSDLCKRLSMKPQAISNQLQRLLDRRILASRRVGNQIYYRIVDPCVPVLIDQGLCLIEDQADGKL